MNATKQTKPKERCQNIAYAWLILPLAAVAVFCVYPAVAAIPLLYGLVAVLR